ncbi:hypothetical protein PYJP_02650 [Pyrofollis japonicus]|uniref:VWA domain-containing protein n=1 Tax=Pyrofollis japonicus TaxID=3060460 RepID=UPI00295BD179|nr:VWA domain-containing protein [Pyrofollis japonicus]BEP16913.1 hypothetical protein PYJP_02650 [Pyrofollis japonicus]
MRVFFSNPLAGVAVAAISALILLRRRLPSRKYAEMNTFFNPLVDFIEKPVYRRPRRLLVLEVLLAILLSLAVASPTIEYTVVKHVEKRSLVQLHIPPRPVVVAIIDVSGSMMGAKLAEAKKALELLVEKLSRLNKTVDIGLIAFSDKVELAVPPGANVSEVLDAIRRLEAGGGTMYTYPLSLAYSWLKIYREFNQTAIIVFASDGIPADRFEYREVLEKLASMGIRVYTVFIGNNPSGRDEVEYMARVGHGKSYVAEKASDLVKVFEKIANETGKIIENTTVTARLTVKVKEQRNLAAPLYAASLAVFLLLSLERYRETRLAL